MSHIVEEEWIAKLDLKAFGDDIRSLEDELRSDLGKEDAEHMYKISKWGRISSFLGYVSSLLGVNPISAFLISQGKFTRWTTVAHHVLHRAYDGIEGINPRYQSKNFARGWWRLWDWLDWIYPPAWEKEHNVLHHYKLGERFDPDVFEDNVERVRNHPSSKKAKFTLLGLGATQWKWFYYAPSTIKQLFSPKKKMQMDEEFDRLRPGDQVFNPLSKQGRALFVHSFIPYTLVNFLLLPALISVFSYQMALSLLLNLIFAEIITNLHTFLVIVPNHTGADLYRFTEGTKSQDEFYLRQIIGSANYRCGGDISDFFHGWLNYQIEHHLWPDMTILQVQKAQPKLKEICRKHHVPYAQESVWKRLARLLKIYLGDESMKVWTYKLSERAS